MKLLFTVFLIISAVGRAQQVPRVGRDVTPSIHEGIPEQEVHAPSQKNLGKGAAAKYLSRDSEESSVPRNHGDNSLFLLVGPYVNSASYGWKGSDKRTGIARNSYGVTYLFDQWHNIDTNIRIDFTDFVIDDERLLKMSLMPLWTFPMTETRFPLYFGFGAGIGVFFKQVEGASNVSFDYQLVSGLRFPDIINNSGFIMEFGMKNHVHLLSGGQLNSTFLSVGAIFTF